MRQTGSTSTPSRLARKGFSCARAELSALAVPLLSLVIAACGGSGGATPAAPPTASASASAAPASTGEPTPRPATPSTPRATSSPESAFPRTIVDDDGISIEIEEEPQSIVSLTPANTEIAYALGAGERMAGGTDFDDFPPEAADLPDVVAGTAVLTEQIVQIDPDLILAGGNNFTPAADVDRLRALGFDVVVVYPQSVDEVLADIRLIGDAVGADRRAADIVDAMEDRIDEVTVAVADLDRPRVFYELGIEPEIFGPAPDSFVADMVNLAGGEAITTTDPAVFSISLERLVAADPEVIVLGDAAYGTCPDSVPGRPGWSDMTAVRDGAIRPVDDIIVTRPGPRLGEGLAALALAIHPDLPIDPPAAGAELCAT